MGVINITEAPYNAAPGNSAAANTDAIHAADAAACSGALGLDGKTVLAQALVQFD